MIVQVENVWKQYQKTVALEAITFCLEQEDVLCVIGPSGSGKSTLLRLLVGLETYDQGTITLFGQELAKLTPLQRKQVTQDIGYIFQEYSLFDHLSVKANIQLAPKLRKQYSKEDLEQKTKEIVTMLQIEDKLSVYPLTLSGGQKQRVAIARSLILQPKLMLWDEPTSALDRASMEELVKTIQLLKQQKIPMIIVTHDLQFAQKVATRLLFMRNSAIIFNKRVEEITNLDTFLIEQFIEKE